MAGGIPCNARLGIVCHYVAQLPQGHELERLLDLPAKRYECRVSTAVRVAGKSVEERGRAGKSVEEQ